MAVQLARLRSRDMQAPHELIAALQQGVLGLFEYLAERVVESLSAEQRHFLRDTSILPHLNPLAVNASWSATTVTRCWRARSTFSRS